MKTKEEKTREAVANLRNHNHKIAAGRLEQSIEQGSIELKPLSSYTDQLIYAALVFANMEVKLDLDPTYTFEIK